MSGRKAAGKGENMKKVTLGVLILAAAAFTIIGCGGPAVVDTSKETHAVPGAKKKQALTAEKM